VKTQQQKSHPVDDFFVIECEVSASSNISRYRSVYRNT